jgi:hypothetical protein
MVKSILKAVMALRAWGLFAGMTIISPVLNTYGVWAIVISTWPSMT